MKKEQAFIEKLYECEKHKKKILLSSKQIESIMPLTLEKYEKLTIEESSFIDQMIFRFLKMQDTMGDKLFPTFLELLGEEVKSKSFIDRLNRIEELGILYKNEWMELRKDRNEVTHEYSFNQKKVVEGINIIFGSTNKLLEIYECFYKDSSNRFEFIRKSKILNQLRNN